MKIRQANKLEFKNIFIIETKIEANYSIYNFVLKEISSKSWCKIKKMKVTLWNLKENIGILIETIEDKRTF